ncbi:MAG: copper chaperone PCu(A)C [Magnetococcales bacterium]|nr:copper chaperone PCu(A)C [Magnetococcales bacterium]
MNTWREYGRSLRLLTAVVALGGVFAIGTVQAGSHGGHGGHEGHKKAGHNSHKGVQVHDAWVREAPPTARVLAAYMSLDNSSDKACALVSVESPDFERVELHNTVVHNGMAHMMKQDAIDIPANAWALLEPGGYHMMLIGRKRALKAGDTVPLKLTFRNGKSQEVTATVRKTVGGGGMKHGSHADHSGHMGH